MTQLTQLKTLKVVTLDLALRNQLSQSSKWLTLLRWTSL